MFRDLLGLVLDLDLLDRYGWRLLEGVGVTAQLVAVSFTLGGVLGLLLGLARLSNNRLLRWFSGAYIYFFRGSPLLAQLFLLYYGLGSLRAFWTDLGLWWFFREAWYCALLAFTLNTAAYQAEIFRSGIQAVPRGQREAAAALGMHKIITFVKVILPQAMIVSLRPLGNELILMVKASAIASLVTIYDLMGVTKLAFSRSYNFELYLWAAVLYLVIVECIRRLWAVLEKRLTRHLRAGELPQATQATWLSRMTKSVLKPNAQ
jgi:polar amino acid transport system permease protein